MKRKEEYQAILSRRADVIFEIERNKLTLKVLKKRNVFLFLITIVVFFQFYLFKTTLSTIITGVWILFFLIAFESYREMGEEAKEKIKIGLIEKARLKEMMNYLENDSKTEREVVQEESENIKTYYGGTNPLD